MPDAYSLTLVEKIDPRHTAVVVIDYQNDFVADDGAFGLSGANVSDCQEIEPHLRRAIAAAREAGVPVIFVQSAYTTDDNRFLSQVFLHQARRAYRGRYHEIPVCEPGTRGWHFFGEIQPRHGESVVSKHRFDAFYNTDLDVLLKAKGIRTLVTTGVTTDCCVESSVRDAFFRDYFVVVPRECVASYAPERSDQALERIDRMFGEVAALEDIVTLWSDAALTSGHVAAAT